MEACRFDDGYLERLRQRDGAVERHFAVYFNRLIFLKISRRVRNRENIEEIQQETLARVFGLIRGGRVKDPAALPGLVATTAENVFREMTREGARARSGEPLPDIADERADTGRDLINEERKRFVRKLLKTLPEKDRKLLYMVYYEDLSREVVCRSLGVTPDHLRLLIHRARIRFRTELIKKSTTRDETDLTLESHPL